MSVMVVYFETKQRPCRRASAVVALLTAMLAASAPTVWAQTAPPSLSAIPQGSPLPRVQVPSAPKLAPGLPAAAPASPTASTPGNAVVVTSAELRGSTAYPAGRFQSLLTSLTGTTDQGLIEDARAQILSAYRQDGYVFTAVTATLEPGQKLVFSVTEGRIVDVKLDGDIGPAGVQVLRFLNHLTEAAPLDVATLERWLLLAQDVPGVTLRTVLRPSAGDPGALSLVAQVSRKSLSGLFAADNRNYSGTGPEGGLAALSANSFTEYGERTDITLFYAARSTEVFGQAATEVFLGGSGLKLRAYFGHGTTDPTGSLGQIGYHGDTSVGGVSLSYPLIKRRETTLSLGAYFDALSGNVFSGTNGTSALASRDDLRVLRLGPDYALRDVVLGDERVGITIANIRLSQGLGLLGASRQGDALAGRAGERIDFSKIAFEASRNQTLFSLSPDTTVAFQPTIAGQYSHDVLPSAEEFFLGGLRFNRGFYSGEVSGDRALTAAFEAQLNTSFSVPGPSGQFDLGTQFYSFYDWGETWQSRKSDANARLQSWGLGVRANFPQGVELDLEGVSRLTRQPLSKSTNTRALPGTGVYWRLVGHF